MNIELESRESSSPMITRAVSSGLRNQFSQSYQFNPFTRFLLKSVGYFSQSVAQYLIPRAQGTNALNVNRVGDLRIEELINERLTDYAANTEKFPAVTLGVGMGGTSAHISLGLGGPFLPQAFVLTLKNGSINGDINRYFNLSASFARRITSNNPGIISIQHYDPVHDGWLVKSVNHLRLKLTYLPESYKEFIRKKVVSGGQVVYLEGGAKWKQFRVGERNVFQVGGWGDIPAEEFLTGSPRIEEYCKKAKIKETNWNLHGYPLIDGYESEWGSEQGFGESVEEFCSKEGYQLLKIRFDEPNQFNRLAFRTVKKLVEMDGREPAGVLVEVFFNMTRLQLCKQV